MRKILDFMDSLVEEGALLDSLRRAPQERQAEENFARRYKRWKRSVLEFFEYIGLVQYRKDLEYIFSFEKTIETAEAVGLVESARDLFRNGFIGDIRHLLHAEMFETVAEQAKGLLESGHIIPAGVLGRIVIERWLRDQAEKAGVGVSKDAKASVVNESLRKAAIFNTPKWRQVQVHLDTGNAAAHGDEKGFTPADVEKLLEFIEANCV